MIPEDPIRYGGGAGGGKTERLRTAPALRSLRPRLFAGMEVEIVEPGLVSGDAHVGRRFTLAGTPRAVDGFWCWALPREWTRDQLWVSEFKLRSTYDGNQKRGWNEPGVVWRPIPELARLYPPHESATRGEIELFVRGFVQAYRR